LPRPIVQSNWFVSVFKPGAKQGDQPTFQLGGPSSGINTPQGIAVDNSGTLYVAIPPHTAGGPPQPVLVAAPIGLPLRLPGAILRFAPGRQGDVAPDATLSGGTTQVFAPVGVAVDNSRRLYVVETSIPSLLIFGPTPGPQSVPAQILNPSTVPLSAFNSPFGIAVGKDGTIYVTNRGDRTVSVIQPNALAWQRGVFTSAETPALPPLDSGAAPFAWGKLGVTTTFHFQDPTGIAVDASNNVYVADSGANTIFVFAPYDFTRVSTQQGPPIGSIAGSATGLSGPALMAVG
jgi:hypothetical protein